MPRKVSHQYYFTMFSPLKHSSWSWQHTCHHVHYAGFIGMQNSRVTSSWISPRFQRKALESRQCVTGSHPFRQPMRGQSVKLWTWRLNFNNNLRMLKMPGIRNVNWGKTQAAHHHDFLLPYSPRINRSKDYVLKLWDKINSFSFKLLISGIFSQQQKV
jgi:hypothetical protein